MPRSQFTVTAYRGLWSVFLALAHINGASADTRSSKASTRAPEGWAASWECSPAFATGPEFENQTIRQTLRLSIGGNRLRIRFTNENSGQPIVIGAARIALPASTRGTIDPATDHRITFNGASQVTIPAGAPVYSDPVDFNMLPLSTVTVSVYLTRHTGPATVHVDGNATAYISADGDHTADVAISDATTSTARFFLSEVDVASTSQSAATLVTLGDSITDGATSSLDQNHRWPDRLAERLAGQQHLGGSIGVANAGIGGNRIWHDLPEPGYGPSILARVDRDVLSVPGLRWVIVLAGINDIGHPTAARLPEQEVSADEIVLGLRQIIDRVRARGAKVYGGTLMPYEGTVYSEFFTAAGEKKRQLVNEWIRNSHAFDSVIDFDAVMRDPHDPSRIRAEYDSGDHLHPNDEGYRHMADTIDLELFKTP